MKILSRLTFLLFAAVFLAAAGFYSFTFVEEKKAENVIFDRIKDTRALNLREALNRLEELGKDISEKQYRKPYAIIKEELGTRFAELGTSLKDDTYFALSRENFEEALKILTLEKYPVEFAELNNSLGRAYSRFAEIKDKDVNLAKALEYYNKAADIYEKKGRKNEASMVLNNAGLVLKSLADSEDKVFNLKKAITFFSLAITKIGKKKKVEVNDLPYYAIYLNNLGVAVKDLASFENRKENLNRCINIFTQVLKIYSFGNTGLDYNKVKENLEDARRLLLKE